MVLFELQWVDKCLFSYRGPQAGQASVLTRNKSFIFGMIQKRNKKI